MTAKRKTRRKAQAEARVGATAQTVARLKPDPIAWLATRRRDVKPEHIRAAEEIRDIYAAVTAGLWPRSQQFEREPAGERSGMPMRLVVAHVDRYLPWTRASGQACSVVFDLVWEGATCAEVDTARRWRKGTAADVVVQSLGVYAMLAGWLSRAA